MTNVENASNTIIANRLTAAGESIDLETAKTLILQMLEIRKEYDEPIKDVINKDSTGNDLKKRSAIRYYTGNRAGYIFNKIQIENLAKQLTDDQDVLIFFEGAREDAQDTKPDGPNVGKPTLIVFPFRLDGDELRLKHDSTGEEHPPIAVVSLTGLENGIPETITEIYPLN